MDNISTNELESAANGFAEFGLDPAIIKALTKMGFKEPSPIQQIAIPLITAGHDVIALAQTGSGKTATCAIPICNRVDTHRKDIQTLIIVPTRELALQYATEVQKIGHYKGVKAFAVYGGADAGLQQSKLRDGVQVLVATPGRLIDFIYSRQIDLSHVTTLILDEADEMLSMGFFEDLDFIIQCLVRTHQTLLFSATMAEGVRRIAMQYMREPQEVNLIAENANPADLHHQFVYCREPTREQELSKIINYTQPTQSIVFCQSRIQVERVCRFLKQAHAGVDFLHAGLGQDVRSTVTNKFRTGKTRILVATDVVSRGLDFSHVSHVYIYHLPKDPDLYVHRAGRTGRYGKVGVVVSIVGPRELHILKAIAKHIQQEPNWLGDPPPSGGTRDKAPAEDRRPAHYKIKRNPDLNS